MHYYRYLYRLPGHAVLTTDMVKISISAADILVNPIIGTPLKQAGSYTASDNVPRLVLIMLGIIGYKNNQIITVQLKLSSISDCRKNAAAKIFKDAG